jgi:hypothetical protein
MPTTVTDRVTMLARAAQLGERLDVKGLRKTVEVLHQRSRFNRNLRP